MNLDGVERFDFDRVPSEVRLLEEIEDPFADAYWAWLQRKVTSIGLGARFDEPCPGAAAVPGVSGQE